LTNPTDMASFVLGITDEVHKFGLEMIKETLEFMDEEIRKDSMDCQHFFRQLF